MGEFLFQASVSGFCFRLLFQASEFYPYLNLQFYGMMKKYVIIAEKVVYDKNMRIT